MFGKGAHKTDRINRCRQGVEAPFLDRLKVLKTDAQPIGDGFERFAVAHAGGPEIGPDAVVIADIRADFAQMQPPALLAVVVLLFRRVFSHVAPHSTHGSPLAQGKGGCICPGIEFLLWIRFDQALEQIANKIRKSQVLQWFI